MAENDGIDKNSRPHVTDAEITVLCRLFSDTITRHLCDLRRRELNAHGIFSCEGCIALKTYEGGNKSN